MKKKGFTLIELLAVIVILAIIALMIIPKLNDLIESSRYASAVDSVLYYVSGANNQAATNAGISGFEDFALNIPEENILETGVDDSELARIKYKGKGPTYVYLLFSGEDKYVSEGHFCIWGYSIDYNFETGTSKSDIDYCDGGGSEPEGPQSCDVLRNNEYDTTAIFKIKNVEDLVCVSEMAKTKTFLDKTIYLVKDIDFNQDSSYEDPNGTTFGDINENGIVEGLKTELTTEKGFYPIGSSSVPFKGTFEGYAKSISNLMINRSQDNVGLFGYNQGRIQGFTLNSSIAGAKFVGGVVGYNDKGIINEIIYTGTVSGTYFTGGITGLSKAGTIKSVLVRDVTIEGSQRLGGIIGNYADSSPAVTGIVIKIALPSFCSYCGKIVGNTSGNYNVYVTNQVTGNLNQSYGGTEIVLRDEILNAYDKVLDTYIGGDNDNSGYYYDYENETSSNIIIKRTEKNPIKFTLKGSGTESDPYIIDNVQHYKEASTLAGKSDSYKFKLTKDIDFTGRHYYALGTNGNALSADIEGDMYTISNVSFACAENCGMIFKNPGYAITGLKLSNIAIEGSNGIIGGLVGYNTGKVEGIIASNINVSSTPTAGGLVGSNDGGIVNDVVFSGTITSNSIGGGVVGTTKGGEITNIFIKDVTLTATNRTGCVIGNTTDVGPKVSGVVEVCTVPYSGSNLGKVAGNTMGEYNAYAASNIAGNFHGSGRDGTSYTLTTEMLNTYDRVIDTWIGGDNDEDGYYFDYENDTSSNIVLKRTKDEPITFTLTGSGTNDDPYIIDSYKHFKEATVKTKDNYKFKLTTDIDFNGKHYYALGTNGNILGSNIDGDMHLLSNITFGCAENCGLIFQNSKTIEGLNINNVTLTSSNEIMGGIVGYNTGTVKGINAVGISLNATASVGIIVGYNENGVIKEVTTDGNINGFSIGGVVGQTDGGEIKSVLTKNVSLSTTNCAGGIFGRLASNTNIPTVTGVVEKAALPDGGYNFGKIAGTTTGSYDGYASSLVTGNTHGEGIDGTSYTLVPPVTVTYSDTEIDSLTYYNNVGVLDTVIGGDDDGSGYYMQYNDTADSIIVVKAGTPSNPSNPGSSTNVSSPVLIEGTKVGENPPTCILEQVIPRSEGIQAILTCEDEEGAPVIRSQWNVNKNALTNQFSDIGIIKDGTVSGNSKTVIPYWSTSNEISQPHPGDCYYYRFGAQDASGNWSYYVTSDCYYGFSN